MLIGRSLELEKNVAPNVDKEADVGSVSRLPSASNALRLIE
jgi:hypothetical protein